jgi:hypothetical protein
MHQMLWQKLTKKTPKTLKYILYMCIMQDMFVTKKLYRSSDLLAQSLRIPVRIHEETLNPNSTCLRQWNVGKLWKKISIENRQIKGSKCYLDSTMISSSQVNYLDAARSSSWCLNPEPPGLTLGSGYSHNTGGYRLVRC